MRKLWAYFILWQQDWCLKHMEHRNLHRVGTIRTCFEYGCSACLQIKADREATRDAKKRKRQTDRKIRALEILGRI